MNTTLSPTGSGSFLTGLDLRLTGRIDAFAAGASRGAPPSRLKILPWGESATTRGPVVVDDTAARALPAAQARVNMRRVALDFQHNTVPGTEAFAAAQEPRPVAAFGSVEIEPGVGVFLDRLEWTPAGAEAFAAGNYPDLSPAVVLDGARRVALVHSAALVRNGAIYGLHAFTATVDSRSAGDDAAATSADLFEVARRERSTPEHVHRMLGVSAASIAKNGGIETARDVHAFAAAPATPIGHAKAATALLTDLMEISELDAYELSKLDWLYDQFIKAPRGGKWSDEHPGKFAGGPLDHEKMEKALPDILGGDREDPKRKAFIDAAWDQVQFLDKVLFAKRAETDSARPYELSVREMWLASGFVAAALGAGIDQGKREQLVEIYWKHRFPRRG
jgi:hypothetical protein